MCLVYLFILFNLLHYPISQQLAEALKIIYVQETFSSKTRSDIKGLFIELSCSHFISANQFSFRSAEYCHNCILYIIIYISIIFLYKCNIWVTLIYSYNQIAIVHLGCVLSSGDQMRCVTE